MKRIKGERAASSVILTIENSDMTVWKIERYDDRLALIIDEDRSIDDVFEVCLLSIENKSLTNERDFWKLQLTDADRTGANPITLIYYLTGGDRIWKHNRNNIWAHDWARLGVLFERKFGDRIKKILLNCKTLSDLRSKILEGPINSESFYDYGLKIGAIRQEDEI